jgi:excisionase family DNA binding protein
LHQEPAVELLTIQEIATLTKLCPRTLRKLKATGRMPKPLTIGAAVRWRASDVREWVALGCPGADEFERRLAAAKGGARC